jgi:hypothetical protein
VAEELVTTRNTRKINDATTIAPPITCGHTIKTKWIVQLHTGHQCSSTPYAGRFLLNGSQRTHFPPFLLPLFLKPLPWECIRATCTATVGLTPFCLRSRITLYQSTQHWSYYYFRSQFTL